jgi:predicted nucleic acid-binding Zn ribbon protein
MKRNSFPSSVGEILERLFNKLSIDKKLKEVNALKLWEEVTGEKISRHSLPLFVRKGNLFVRVDSSGWLTQLSYLKHEIISELNERLGGESIKNIYFRLGEVKKRRKGEIKAAKVRIDLEKEELARIEEKLKGVKNKSFQPVLSRILIKDKKIKKERPHKP